MQKSTKKAQKMCLFGTSQLKRYIIVSYILYLRKTRIKSFYKKKFDSNKNNININLDNQNESGNQLDEDQLVDVCFIIELLNNFSQFFMIFNIITFIEKFNSFSGLLGCINSKNVQMC